MKKKIITAVCLLSVLALCITIFVVSSIRRKIPENPPGTVGNTSGNLYNKGLFCEKDGYVYFANAYDGSALYSMRSDETDMKKLIPTEVTSINTDGNYLYYYQASSGSGEGFGYVVSSSGIFRVNIKNTKNSACLDRVLSKYVLLADNSVYYTCAGDTLSLKRVSTDGKDKETLLDLDILPVSIQNSQFYYMNNQDNLHLMVLDLNTKATSQVATEDVYMPIIEGNMVYCIDIHDGYSLISLNLSDGTKTLLDNARTDVLNITDSHIYYQTSGDNPQLKRIRKDGSDMEVVADGTYTNINTTSQNVYFTRFGSDTPIYKTPVYGPVNVTTFDAASNAALQQAIKKK